MSTLEAKRVLFIQGGCMPQPEGTEGLPPYSPPESSGTGLPRHARRAACLTITPTNDPEGSIEQELKGIDEA